MKPTRLLPPLAALLLLAPFAPAQTATWIAPGQVPTRADWNDPANWSTGVVPNGGAASALINTASVGGRGTSAPYDYYTFSFPPLTGGASPVLTGNVTLDELHYDLRTAGYLSIAALYIGSPDTNAPGSLRLEGRGLTFSAVDTTRVDINVLPGSTLTFANHAVTYGDYYVQFHLFLTGAPGNPATLRVQDDAVFGTGLLSTNLLGLHETYSLSGGDGPVIIDFKDRARVAQAQFNLPSQSSVGFYNQTDAGNAIFRLRDDSLVLFAGSATAGSAQMIFDQVPATARTSTIRFAESSTAAQSIITSPTNHWGAVEFTDQATGGTASVRAHLLDITGATTGTGTTGRQRASDSIPAPTSVVADDARTISLNSVVVQDLLLGSNTLEVKSGVIGNIRNDGGAYRSTAGDNLAGGGLLKTGPGTLILNYPTFNPADPDHPSYYVFTGPTIIRQGEVALYNRIGPTTVESAGTLRGNGSVNGNLLNQGRFAPEPLATVTGNYVQSAGATYVFNSNHLLDPAPALPLQVGGSATLAGRLDTFAYAGLFPNRAPATLTAVALTAGSISGRFDAVGGENTPVRARVTPEYSATSVTLRFEWLPIASLVTTPGRQALGAYLDANYHYIGIQFPPNYNAIVDGLNIITNPADFAAALDNFSPDRYGVVLEQGLATATARAGTLDRQLAATREATRDGLAVFAEGTSRRATYEAVDGLPEASARTSGGLAGARWRKGDLAFGFYAARENTSADLDAAGSRARVKSTEPGVFAQYARDGLFASATASYSRDDYRLDRLVDYKFFAYSALNSAAPSGHRTDLGLTVGRSLQRKQWSAAVFAGVLHSSWQCDDFTETSNSSLRFEQLAIAGWSGRSLRSRAGVEFTKGTADGRFRAHLKAVWLHEFETDRAIPARFVTATTGYVAPGRPAEENLYQASLGLDWRLSRRLVFSAAASTARGDHSRTTSDLSAGFRWEF